MKLGPYLYHLKTFNIPNNESVNEWVGVQRGLVSSGVSLTSWGKDASLALVGHPSSDGTTIKMPYGVDVLHRPASHPHLFLLGWLKLNLAFLLDPLRLA